VRFNSVMGQHVKIIEKYIGDTDIIRVRQLRVDILVLQKVLRSVVFVGLLVRSLTSDYWPEVGQVNLSRSGRRRWRPVEGLHSTNAFSSLFSFYLYY